MCEEKGNTYSTYALGDATALDLFCIATMTMILTRCAPEKPAKCSVKVAKNGKLQEGKYIFL